MLGLFGTRQCFSTWGILFPIPPSLRPWSDNRNRILERYVEALITCKINNDFSCCDFQESIKSNKDFLKKVLSTEKYCWANV